MDNLGNKKSENRANRTQEDQEEIVLRVTSRYVEEVQAGRQPNLSDYLSRYPQYADAIASFIAYYQTIELPLSQFQATSDIPDYIRGSEETGFTDELHIAEEYAWQRVMLPNQTSEAENHTPAVYDDKGKDASYVPEAHTGGATDIKGYGQTIQTLFSMAERQQFSSFQLADHLHISEDIIVLLEKQVIVPQSIPVELYRRLAAILQQPVHHMQNSFSIEHRRVAENPGSYEIGTTADGTEQIGFREALENSKTISPEQAQFWYDVLSREGL